MPSWPQMLSSICPGNCSQGSRSALWFRHQRELTHRRVAGPQEAQVALRRLVL